jgi:hypothetical protein
MTYRTLIGRVHPASRELCRFKLNRDTRYLIGKPGDWTQFPDISSAIRYHAIVTGSSADFVEIREDHTAPMHKGRLTVLGHVAADGDKQGSARGSMPRWDRGEVTRW